MKCKNLRYLTACICALSVCLWHCWLLLLKGIHLVNFTATSVWKDVIGVLWEMTIGLRLPGKWPVMVMCCVIAGSYCGRTASCCSLCQWHRDCKSTKGLWTEEGSLWPRSSEQEGSVWSGIQSSGLCYCQSFRTWWYTVNHILTDICIQLLEIITF